MRLPRRGDPRAPGLPEVDWEYIDSLPDVEQAKVRAELLELESRITTNPLEVYDPHPRQATFHGARTPIRAFLGGNRSGKTTAGIVDDLIQCIDNAVVPEHLRPFKKWEPPFYCRIVTPDFANTLEVVYQKIREYVPRSQLHKHSWDKAFAKQHRTLTFENGSVIYFMSAEQDLDKFGGQALHRVHYDEEPPAPIRRECLMRLIDYGGDEVFTMTPLHGMSWMYHEVYQRRDEPYITVVQVDMDDNPHLDQATKQRTLDAIPTDEEREARKTGRFVHFAGLIYPEFDREHIVEQHDVPDNAQVFVGIDPGMRYMAAVVFAYLDEEDCLVVFDEIGMQGKTSRDVCEAIHKINMDRGVTPSWYVIDPISRNKNPQTGRSEASEYSDNGIVAFPGQNAVQAGINRVKERLQQEPPKLQIMAHCQLLIGQFRLYRWKQTKLRDQDEDDRTAKPIKKDDHLLDALRYLVMARPLKPEPIPELQDEPYYVRLLREDIEGFANEGPPQSPTEGGIYA